MTRVNKPEVGDLALEYDYVTDTWYATPRKITEFIDYGLVGWLVELNGRTLVEVEEMEIPHEYRELPPKDRRAKHQGYTAGPE